jgi:peroxiredoxin (alkyl hydroperoxide reductase subunit C)
MNPEGKVRLIMYYPLNVGRNMAEIKRALLALQTSDEHKVAMPLDWQPGDKVIVPAPKTVEALAERKSSDLEMVDWYLAKKSI